MMLIDGVQWWYGAAWSQVWQNVLHRADAVLDAFSVKLLARTLFAPFRQIDAGSTRGPIGVQLRAWFDRTFSRIVGFFIRSTMIIIGCILAGLTVIIGVLWAILWIFIPFLPVIGIALALTGWTIL